MKCRKPKKTYSVNEDGQIRNVDPIRSKRARAMVDMMSVLSTLNELDELVESVSSEEVGDDDGEVSDQV